MTYVSRVIGVHLVTCCCIHVTLFPAAMASRMTQYVTLLLLLLPLLTVLRVSEGRPSGDADYLYKYEDLSPLVRNTLYLIHM